MFDISIKEASEVTQRLKRFQESRPNDALANYYYAMTLWKGPRGEVSEANQLKKDEVSRLLSRAKSLDPKFPDVPFQLGVLYVEEHKYNQALPEFQQALKLKPDLAEAHYHLGQVYSRLGEKASAKREYDLYEQFHKQEMTEDERRSKRIGQVVYSLQEPSSSP